jgi:DNA repair protein RecO
MHVEGIIIHKTPYKERDLICNLLLRSGKILSIYFYGGRGGGKRNKGSILEVGFMLAIELNPRRKKIESDIQIAKEYKLLWDCDHIRTDFKAFYLASFYLEYMAKIAVEDDLVVSNDQEHAGLFNVLSNGLFYLDESIRNKDFFLNTHLFIFLTKLAVQMGITQDVETCLYCKKEFNLTELCLFDPQNGGFSCIECSSQKDEFLTDNKILREEYQSSQQMRLALKKVYQIPYKSYGEIPEITQGLASAEFNYINYQFGFTKDQIKSWQMISAQ